MFSKLSVDQNCTWNDSTRYTESIQIDEEIFWNSKIWKGNKKCTSNFYFTNRIQRPKPWKAIAQAVNKIVTRAGFPHLLGYVTCVSSGTAWICFFKTKIGTTEMSMQIVCNSILATRLPWIPHLMCCKNLFSPHSMYTGPKLAVGIGRYFMSSEFLPFVSPCYGNH